MDSRDIEDVIMQGREEGTQVMSEAQQEMTDTTMKRALGEMWANIPPEVKAQMAMEKPEVVREMDKLYGGATEIPQGNPWGTAPIEEQSPWQVKKGR